MRSSQKENKKKTMVRVACLGLAVIMILSVFATLIMQLVYFGI